MGYNLNFFLNSKIPSPTVHLKMVLYFKNKNKILLYTFKLYNIML